MHPPILQMWYASVKQIQEVAKNTIQRHGSWLQVTISKLLIDNTDDELSEVKMAISELFSVKSRVTWSYRISGATWGERVEPFCQADSRSDECNTTT